MYANLLAEFKKLKEAELDEETDFYIAKWELAEKDAAKTKADSDRKVGEQIALSQKYLSLAQDTASLLGQLSSIQTDKDKALIESQRKAVEEQLKSGAITEKAAAASLAKSAVPVVVGKSG